MDAAVPAASYSRMKPFAPRATSLTPYRSASASKTCAALYDIQGAAFILASKKN